jgi:hypothetical protein
MEPCNCCLDGAGGLLHPEHHGGENAHGNQRHHGFKQLLLLLREFLLGHFQAKPTPRLSRQASTTPSHTAGIQRC